MKRRFIPLLAAALGASLPGVSEAKQTDEAKFRAERVEEGGLLQVERGCLAVDVERLSGAKSLAINTAIAKGKVDIALSNLDPQHRAAFAILQELARENYGVEISVAELMSLISHESGWKSEVQSDTTAVGLGQFIPTSFSGEMNRYKDLYEGLLCEELPDPMKMRHLYVSKYKALYAGGWEGPDSKKDPAAYAEYQEMKDFFDLRENDVISIVALGVHWLEFKRAYTRYNQGAHGESILKEYEDSEDKVSAWENLAWHQKEHPRTTKVRKALSQRGYNLEPGHLKFSQLPAMGEIHSAFAKFDETTAAEPESESLRLVAKVRLFSALGMEALDEPDYEYPVRFYRSIKAIGHEIRTQGQQMEAAHDVNRLAFGDFELVDKIDRVGPMLKKMKAEQDALAAAKQEEEEARKKAALTAHKVPAELRAPLGYTADHYQEKVVLRTRREEFPQFMLTTEKYENEAVSYGTGAVEFQEFLENTEDFTAILAWLEDDPIIGEKLSRYSRYRDWSRTRCLRDVLHDLELVLSADKMDYLEGKIQHYFRTAEIGTVSMLEHGPEETGGLEAQQVHRMDGGEPDLVDPPQILEDPVLTAELAQTSWVDVLSKLERSEYQELLTNYKHYGGKLNTLGDFFNNLKEAVEEGELQTAELNEFKAYIEKTQFKASVKLESKPPLEWMAGHSVADIIEVNKHTVEPIEALPERMILVRGENSKTLFDSEYIPDVTDLMVEVNEKGAAMVEAEWEEDESPEPKVSQVLVKFEEDTDEVRPVTATTTVEGYQRPKLYIPPKPKGFFGSFADTVRKKTKSLFSGWRKEA